MTATLTAGCVDYRSLHCSPDYRLALWRIPPFSFRGWLPGCSWLDSTQSIGAWTRNERQARALGGGKTALSHPSRPSLERLQPRHSPAEELLSARQTPNTPTDWHKQLRFSSHSYSSNRVGGCANCRTLLVNWTEWENPVSKHHVRHSCTCHRTQPTSRPKSNSCLF